MTAGIIRTIVIDREEAHPRLQMQSESEHCLHLTFTFTPFDPSDRLPFLEECGVSDGGRRTYCIAPAKLYLFRG